MSQSILRSVITFSVVLLLLVSFAVWLTSVKDYVREFILSEMAAHQYDPHRVRSVCIAAALIGTVFVFCAGTFQEQLGILQDEYTNGKKSLDTLFYWIDENETSKKADMVETEGAWLARYARHAADFISEYPELEEEETLDRFCQAMNADYMILFDEDGKEILTNSGYKGLTLYDGNTAGMSAFRKPSSARDSPIFCGPPAIPWWMPASGRATWSSSGNRRSARSGISWSPSMKTTRTR